jgi:hypothetical protein
MEDLLGWPGFGADQEMDLPPLRVSLSRKGTVKLFLASSAAPDRRPIDFHFRKSQKYLTD